MKAYLHAKVIYDTGKKVIDMLNIGTKNTFGWRKIIISKPSSILNLRKVFEVYPENQFYLGFLGMYNMSI